LNRALFIGLVLIASTVGAQHYEHTLKKCIKNFQDGLSDFTNGNATAEVERRYRVLDECMRGQKFPAFKLSPTAVAAIPYLNELVEEYKGKDFVILSFSSEGFETLAKFIKANPIRYRVFDKSRDLINHQFQTLLGYPTMIILNKKGEVAKYKVGGGMKPDELKKDKERLKGVIDFELGN
jgi:thiol-disulfide isomerase/thioredoxin